MDDVPLIISLNKCCKADDVPSHPDNSIKVNLDFFLVMPRNGDITRSYCFEIMPQANKNIIFDLNIYIDLDNFNCSKR